MEQMLTAFHARVWVPFILQPDSDPSSSAVITFMLNSHWLTD